MPDSENRIRRKLGQLLLLPVFIAITPAAFADEIVTFADLQNICFGSRGSHVRIMSPRPIKSRDYDILTSSVLMRILGRCSNIHSLRLRLGGRWRRTSEIRTGSLGVSTSRRFSKAMRYSL